MHGLRVEASRNCSTGSGAWLTGGHAMFSAVDLLRLANVRGHVIYLPLLGEDPLVLDCGANRGEFCRALADRVRAGDFRLVEANPRLASELREAGFRVEECAVSDQAGEMTFHIAENDEGSSLRELPKASIMGCVAVDSVPVRTRPLVDLLREAGCPVDLLKVDIEGAETAALSSLSADDLRGVGQITVEFHSAGLFGGLVDSDSVEATICHLARAGFLVLDFTALRPHYPRTDVLFVNRQRISRGEQAYLRTAAWARPRLQLPWRVVRGVR